jgi:hypothetical protein
MHGIGKIAKIWLRISLLQFDIDDHFERFRMNEQSHVPDFKPVF